MSAGIHGRSITARRRVLFIQHQDDCPPGHLGERAGQLGLSAEVVRAGRDPWPPAAGYDLVVPLGSGHSAYDSSVPYLAGETRLLREAVDAGVPVLGICFGAQLLARVLGGDVSPMPDGPEIGWLPISTRDQALIDPGPWMVWHFDAMTAPPGAEEVAWTAFGTQAFRYGPHVGVQFHPEATSASIGSWARTYRLALTQRGITAGDLAAETRRREGPARARGHALLDRVLELSDSSACAGAEGTRASTGES
jgi:GMP synthase-like glutamine amidotransferase